VYRSVVPFFVLVVLTLLIVTYLPHLSLMLVGEGH